MNCDPIQNSYTIVNRQLVKANGSGIIEIVLYVNIVEDNIMLVQQDLQTLKNMMESVVSTRISESENLLFKEMDGLQTNMTNRIEKLIDVWNPCNMR